MQQRIPFGKTVKFIPKRGMSVRPHPERIVTSHALLGWERGMVYSVSESGEMGVQEVTIKGIKDGREFNTIEFSDNLLELEDD